MARQRRDPHRDVEPVQGAREHPAIAAVVAGPRGDQHAVAEPVRVALRQHGGGGAAGAFP